MSHEMFHALLVLGFFTSIEASRILEKNIYRFKPIICRTEDCRTMGNVILSAMNKTAEPCEDFYEYACGAWLHSNDALPPEEATWNRVAMFNKKLSEKLRAILESKNVDEPAVQKAKQWYRSCMNEEVLESRGIEPLTSIVSAVGGWPLAMPLGQWNPFDYSWQEIELYYSRITGSCAMYDVVVTQSYENVSQNEIMIKAPKLMEHLEVDTRYFDLREREAYGALIAGVAKLFVGDARISDEKISKEVNDLIEFQTNLENIRDEGALARSNISLVQQFIDKYTPDNEISNINLFTIVTNLVGGVGETEISQGETIDVDALYIIKLSILLNETSFRTIVNYVHWYYLSQLLYTANSEMRNLLLNFMKEMMGMREPLPRWRECVDQIGPKHALSYRFVMDEFTEDTYNSAVEMIERIRIELEKQINESTWMDVQTKESFGRKLRNVRTFVGYPDWYKDRSNLEKYYGKLKVGDDYFTNVVNHMKFERKKMYASLRDTKNEPEWFSDPITVNAFYIFHANSLNIPAADFQPPVFTPMMPEAVKYGIIGSMLGHELSHAFDDTGYNFDETGRVIDWPETVMSSYWERIRCFIEQYDNFTNESTREKTFYGNKTVGENIADTMGVQAVFGAYTSAIRENVKGDRKLLGFEDLSNEQLFFLSYATIWCEISTPEYERKFAISGDPHGSSRVRTLSTVSNMEGFAEAFNCPRGAPMNPEKKCNIWKGDL